MAFPWETARTPGSGPGILDQGKAFVRVGLPQLGQAVTGLGAYLGDQMDGEFGDLISAGAQWANTRLGQMAEGGFQSLSPEHQQRLTAEIGSEEFWQAPLSSVLSKAVVASPTILASVAGAIFTPASIPTLVSIGATSGGLSAGMWLGQQYDRIGKAPEEELLKSDYYAGLRATGMSEEEAREALMERLAGLKPALLFGVGALTGAVGVPGQVARAVGVGVPAGARAATGSLVGRTAAGAALGGGTEFVQSGVESQLGEQGQVDVGLQKEIDWDRVWNDALEGGVVGAAIGGPADAIGGRARSAPATQTIAGAAAAPPATQAIPTGAAPPPTPVTPPGNSPVAPTPPPAAAATTTIPRQRTRPIPIQTVQPIGPDAAQQAALTARQTEATPPAAQLAPPPALAPTPSQGVGPAPTPALQPAPGGPLPGGAPAAAPAGPVPPPTALTPAPTPPAPGPVGSPVAPLAPVTPPKLAEVQARVRAPRGATPKPALPTPAPVTDIPPEFQTGPPGAPRILQDLTSDPYALEYAEQAEGIQANAKGVLADPNAPKRSHRGAAVEAKRESDATTAKGLFEQNVPETDVIPTTKPQQQALKERLERIIKAAAAAGIRVPRRVTDASSDHLMWLREVQDMLDSFGAKRGPTLDRIQTFLLRERAAKGGDFSIMRSERIAEGEAASRVSQGDVEQRAGLAGQGAWTEGEAAVREASTDAVADREVVLRDSQGNEEKSTLPGNVTGKVELGADETIVGTDDVPTKISKSAPRLDDMSEKAKVGGKEVDRAKAASDVRKVEITDEMRAKYNTGPVTPKGNKPEPKPEPAPAKLAAVKEKVEEAKKTRAPVKERVKAAAKSTDRKPSEAKKEAGNYTKGHVSVQGLSITIENPKGSVRSGTAPDGTEWQVKMPAHYGYIRRTEGADGDQVDVFLGPDPESDIVIVIDQVDPDTRAFDEHKVLLGFNNVGAATTAYDWSFSDGRGAERVGDFKIMTVAEFKAWLAGDTTVPAGEVLPAEVPEPSQLTANMTSGPSPTTIPNPHAIQKWIDQDFKNAPQRRRFIEANATLRGDLNKFLTASKLQLNVPAGIGNSGLFKALFPAMRARILAAAGDTPVFVLPDELYMHTADGPSYGFYDPLQHAIVLPESTLLDTDARGFDGPSAGQVILHEGAHAAFMGAIWNNRTARGQLEQILAVARNTLPSDLPNGLGYGLTDVDELVAEAFTNSGFQELLAKIDATPELISALKLDGRIRSLWDTFIQIVRKVLGLPNAHTSLLSAVMKVGARLELGAAVYSAPMDRNTATEMLTVRASAIAPLARAITSRVTSALNSVVTRPEMQAQQGAPRFLKLRTLDQLAQEAKRFFQNNNPVRVIADLVERIRTSTSARMRAAEPIISKLYKLERQHTASGQWRAFTELVHDETMAGVFANQPLSAQTWLGKDRLDSAWSKAQHADLAARYAALPADLQAARAEAMAFFTQQQNEMSLGIINNRILKVLGINDLALGMRIHTNTTTAADQALFEPGVLDTILEARELAKLDGPYFPLMRRGDHVVRARYVVTPPGNSPSSTWSQLNENTYEFKGKLARKAAIRFAIGQGTRPTVSSVYVDKATGLRYFTDPTTGAQIPVTSQDLNAEQRFRVEVQDRHVEFFDSANEARAAAAELTNQQGIAEVLGVEERRFEQNSRQSDMLSFQMRQLMDSLERRSGYRGLTPQQQNELVQTLNEASLRFLGSTRIQSHRLPRRYIEGASRDLTRNTLQYAQSAAGYLSRLEHQPSLDAAVKEMRDQVGSSQYGKDTTLGASSIANEVERRLANQNGFQADGSKLGAIASRVMTASFLDKLFGPSYAIINATQPVMITFPVLAARHGLGTAFRALGRAYDDIGGLTVLKQGARDLVSKAKSQNNPTSDLLGDIKSRVTRLEAQMFDYLTDRGAIDPDAGLEIAEMIKSRDGVMGRVDQGLGYLDGVARQMPRAIEMINRAASALAAYRLEVTRGGNHEAAMLYAQETVNNTQFNYSTTNAPPIFNHPVARVALQFKKYAQGMYHLLGSQVGKAWRNAEPGDRAEALKTLGGILVLHAAMAGALGLPTEPLKAFLLGMKAVGLTAVGWEDVEQKWREILAESVGSDLAEVISRGIPRAFGIDVSSRMGLDSLLTFGEPRSDSESDVVSWIAKTVAGAPPGLAIDWVKGSNKLFDGDIAGAAELLVPIKSFSDALRAYRQGTEGKYTEGGRESMAPYSAGESVARILGFTPGREAETQERQSAYFNTKTRDDGDRADLMQAWATASSGERGRVWGRVESFNRGRPRNERLTRQELQEYARRRRQEERSGTMQGPLRVTRRDTGLLARVDATYNN